MPATRSDRFRIGDIACAFSLLTRFPSQCNPNRMAAAAWAWPIAGATVGAAAAVVAAAVQFAELPASLAAAIAMATSAALTGAMHEDGLADTADGFWGGRNHARRLEIMKDSRVGTYGVLALILSLLARWSLLTPLLALPGGLWALPVVGAVSRTPMAALAAALPHARADGLSAQTGRPPDIAVWGAAMLAALVALVYLGWALITLAFWLTAVTLAMAMIARAKVGGQTGDVLGATQQLAEIAALAVLLSALV